MQFHQLMRIILFQNHLQNKFDSSYTISFTGLKIIPMKYFLQKFR